MGRKRPRAWSIRVCQTGGRSQVLELTDAQLRELQGDLRDLVGRLEQALAGSEESVKPVDLDLPIGRLSRMDALQQQTVAQANRRSVETRLGQARAALAAIEEDSYGTCRICDEPIGFKRLKARPETPLCVACRSHAEGRR